MKAKKKRNLIIMAIAAILLIGILVTLQVVNNINEKKDGEDSDQGTLITSFSQEEISQVSYQYRDEEKVNYKLVKDTWQNADDADFPLSSEAFANNFVGAFVQIKTSRTLTAEDEQNYGLDDPYLTLEVENSGGEKELFYLGDYNSMLGEYYLKIDGKDEIYTIGTDLVYICREDIYDYATMESFPSYSTDTLKNIRIVNDGTVVELAYFENGYETDLIGQCKWFFGAPFSYYRSAETNKIDEMTQDVIDVLQFKKLVNYKPTEEELVAYGLKDSTRQYRINYTEKDEETNVTRDCASIVEFGNYDSETDCYYARVIEMTGNAQEVSNYIYLIDKADIEALLGIDPMDYVYKYAAYIKLQDIAAMPKTESTEAQEAGSITFITPDGEFVLKNNTTYDENGKKIENLYEINGKEVEEDAVEDFYFEVLDDCGMERIIYDRSTIVTDKEPTYTIQYQRNIDDYYGDVTVEYVQYDSNYYQVSVDGVTDILVNKRIVDETMAQLTEIVK